jgi:hypothetical protein
LQYALENGDTAIVSGEHSDEALQNAGITAHAISGTATTRNQLVLDGFGPQQYEIRELLIAAHLPWPIIPPVNASVALLRDFPHDSEPVQFATPSPYDSSFATSCQHPTFQL